MGKVRKTLKKFVSIFLISILCTSLWNAAGIEMVSGEDSELITVSLMKMWDDYGNVNGKRPDELVVTLLADGEEIISKTLTENKNGIYDSFNVCFAWYYEYEEVPMYNDSGEEIVYTWTCNEIEDYTRYLEETGHMTIITDYQPLGDELQEEPVILKKVDEKGDRLNDCLLRVTNGDHEILRWVSGDNESVEITKEGVTANLNEYGDIVIYGLENDVEYTYEELKPAEGYTLSDSIDFKLAEEERNYSYNWYTSIEKAAEDASNLTTENADCYMPDAEAGVFVDGDTATIILLKDTTDTQTFQLSADITLDLNDKTLNMTDGGSIQHNDNLTIKDGTVKFENESTGIDGNVSSDYFSDESLNLQNLKIISNSSISGVKIINSVSSEITIEDSEINGVNSAGGYNVYVSNNAGQLNILNSTVSILTTDSSSELKNIYSMAKTATINGSTVTTLGGYISHGVYCYGGNLFMSDNNFYSEGRYDLYNVQAFSSIVDIDSGFYKSKGTGKGSTHNISIEVYSDAVISGGTYYSECSSSTGMCSGISVSYSDADVYNVESKAYGKSNNSGLRVSGKSSVNVLGGNYYAQPVDSENGTNDAYGAGLYVGNKSTVLVDEVKGDVLISGGNAGIINVYGSNLTVNSGTFCSPNHGGIYCASGSAGKCKINGGLFYNNYNEYDSEEMGKIHPFGAGYFGCDSTSSKSWSVDVSNATFLGKSATYGVVQKSNDGYIPATINLYNCYVSGTMNDLLIQPNESVSKYNAYINIYDGTVLKSNSINDQYEVNYGESHVIDYRENE